MSNIMKNKRTVISVCIRTFMFLVAILPLTKHNGSIFYACSGIGLVLFLTATVLALVPSETGKSNVPSMKKTSCTRDFIDCLIAIIGIIACMTTSHYKFSYFWMAWLLIIILRRIYKNILKRHCRL